MNDLNMYIVYDGEPSEGALLAFACTGQEARVLGRRDSWLVDAEFIDIRARRLPDGETTAHLRAAAESSGPHVVEFSAVVPKLRAVGSGDLGRGVLGVCGGGRVRRVHLMTRNEARSELIRIAADLVRMQTPLPSNLEDHRQKTYSASVVARAMERHEDRLKGLAVRVRRAWEALK